MRTTEIFVEQVFIGFVSLLVFCLPFHIELRQFAESHLTLDEFSKLGVAAFAVGIAYLFGIVFDRVGDSILGTLEQHHRLRAGLRGIDLNDARWIVLKLDPFPEDKLRVSALKAGGEFLVWINYLRVRMRLTRALALYLPALTLSAIVGLVRLNCWDDYPSSEFDGLWPAFACEARGFGGLAPWSLGLLLLIYAGAPSLCSLLGRASDKGCYRSKPVGPFVWDSYTWKPPKTDDAKARRYASRRGLRKKEPGKSDRKYLAGDIFLNPLTGGWLLLLVATLAISYFLTPHSLALVGLFGNALAWLAAWAWWRTTGTYFSYLKDAGP